MNYRKVTFILPTCEPIMMFKFLLPSIHYLKPLKSIIEFNICFQPPYTKSQIKEVLKEFKKCHLKVNYMFKDYKVVKPFTPLIKMRNDCAMLSPNSDIYGLLDDDMSFESEEICNCIRNMLNRFKNEPKLSVISFYNQEVINYKENFYSTNAGLFYKGGKYFGFKGLVPSYLSQFNRKVYTKIPYNNENLINLFGGHQDKFCAMIRLASRTYGRCMIGIPVNHLENRRARGDKEHGWKDAEVLEGSITSFILKYFNKNFTDTHALTLFDKEEDIKVYPFKYENGVLKEEYNLYDDRGIIKDWFSTKNDRYSGGNPYITKYREATYKSKWTKKSLINRYNHLKEIGLLEHLPNDIVEDIERMVNDTKIRTKIITVFSVDYYGKNKFKRDNAKDCYWSWNKSLSLPIRRNLKYDFMMKVFDPRWENEDLNYFKNKYKTELKSMTDKEKERLFILYIMSKYPNHLYIDSKVFLLDNDEIKNEEMFDENWLYVYNKDNLKFFKDLFNDFIRKSTNIIDLNNRINNFSNRLNYEIKQEN